MAKKMNRMSRREFVKELGLAMAAISAASCTSLPFSNRRPSSDENFDYIVIGSGAGGGPVAANLAKAGFRVLIIEAGGNNSGRNYSVPVFHPNASEDPNLSWSFFVNHYSKPERQRLDSKFQAGKGILYPRGSTLGGSTAHNAMIALYPDNSDWTRIVQLTGDTSWSPEAMRTYFQRVENASYRQIRNEQSRHGFEGWLNLEQTNPLILKNDQKLLAMVTSAIEYGAGGGYRFEDFGNVASQVWAEGLDPNDWNYVLNKLDGVFIIPKATLAGQRTGTREHILKTARDTGNISIWTGCLAKKILFAPEDPKRAIGVEYVEGTSLYRADLRAPAGASPTAISKAVYAKKEIILSGGAFNSPQLLMLSGIGPSDVLSPLGIPLRHELKGVGKNLQDRYEVTVTTELRGELNLLKGCTFGEANDPCLQDYDKNPTQHAYGTNGVCIALVRRSTMDKPDPDLVIFGVPGKFKGYVPGYSKSAAAKDHFTWAILKGHTNNTGGEVRLRSSDALDTPDINFKYFDEGTDTSGEDLEAVLSGLKMARDINKHLLAKIVSKVEDIPGLQAKTDHDLRQHIQREAWGHHASCTNKIGSEQDPMAVLNSKFCVQGIQNLRVVDASVFPRIPGLFIVAPIYMIAEKASDDIIADARRP